MVVFSLNEREATFKIPYFGREPACLDWIGGIDIKAFRLLLAVVIHGYIVVLSMLPLLQYTL